MELDEFKNMWQSQYNDAAMNKSFSSQPLTDIPMKTSNTLTLLQKTNAKWLTYALKQLPLIIVVFVFNLIFYLVLPDTENVDNFKYGAILFFVLLISGSLIVLAAYIQYKIFNIKPNDNIKSALQTAIQRFNFFFKYIFFVFIPVCLVVFIVVVTYLLRAFKLEFSGGMILFISISLTAFTFITTYIYYRKTYFPWITQLKKNLDELIEE